MYSLNIFNPFDPTYARKWFFKCLITWMSECFVSKGDRPTYQHNVIVCFSGAVDQCLGSVPHWRLWYQMRWTVPSSPRRYRWGPTWQHGKSARSLPTRCGSRTPRTTASISLSMEKVHISFIESIKTCVINKGVYNLYFENDRIQGLTFLNIYLILIIIGTNMYKCWLGGKVPLEF